MDNQQEKERVEYSDQLNWSKLQDKQVVFQNGLAFNAHEEEKPSGLSLTSLENFMESVKGMEEHSTCIALVSSNQVSFDDDPTFCQISDFKGGTHEIESKRLAEIMGFSVTMEGTSWKEISETFKTCFDLSVAKETSIGKLQFLAIYGAKIRTSTYRLSAFPELQAKVMTDEYVLSLSNLNHSGTEWKVLNAQQFNPIELGDFEYDATKDLTEHLDCGTLGLSMPSLGLHLSEINKWAARNEVPLKVKEFDPSNKLTIIQDEQLGEFTNEWVLYWNTTTINPSYSISHRVVRTVCSNGMVTEAKQLENILPKDFIKEESKRGLLPIFNKAVKVPNLKEGCAAIVSLEAQGVYDLNRVEEAYLDVFRDKGALDFEDICATLVKVKSCISQFPPSMVDAVLGQILLTERGVIVEKAQKVENYYDVLNMVTFLLQSKECFWAFYHLGVCMNKITAEILGDDSEGEELYQKLLVELGYDSAPLDFDGFSETRELMEGEGS